jgi:anaerobic selenocysteine-containing dehydrogenase
LLMHPADAAARGLTDGQQVLVTSANGEIASTIAMDEALMPGVVSMVHGWGHRASPSLGVASTYPGSNPNALLPIGDGSYEPLSSQAHMTGIPVTVSDAVSDGTSARGA